MTLVILALVAVAVYATYKHFDASAAKADLAKVHDVLVSVSAKVESAVKNEVDALVESLKKWL